MELRSIIHVDLSNFVVNSFCAVYSAEIFCLPTFQILKLNYFLVNFWKNDTRGSGDFNFDTLEKRQYEAEYTNLPAAYDYHVRIFFTNQSHTDFDNMSWSYNHWKNRNYNNVTEPKSTQFEMEKKEETMH